MRTPEFDVSALADLLACVEGTDAVPVGAAADNLALQLAAFAKLLADDPPGPDEPYRGWWATGARVCVGLSRLGRLEEALNWLFAFNAHPAVERPAQIHGLVTCMQRDVGRPARRAALLVDLLPKASPVMVPVVHNFVAEMLVDYGELDAILVHAHAALGHPHADAFDRLWARTMLAMGYINDSQLAQAAYVLPAAEDIDPRTGPLLMYLQARAEALLWYRRGSFEKALRVLTDLERRLDPEQAPVQQRVLHLALVLQVATDAGNRAVAEETLAQLDALSERLGPNAEVEALVLFARGFAALSSGEHDLALRVLAEAAVALENVGFHHIVQIATANLAIAAHLCGDDPTFEAMALTLEQFGPQNPLLRATLERTRGMRALEEDTDAALGHLGRAAEHYGASGLVFHEADTLSLLAWVESDLERAILAGQRAMQLIQALATFLDDERMRLELLARVRYIGYGQMWRHLAHEDVPAALATVFEMKSGDFLRLLFERDQRRRKSAERGLPTSEISRAALGMEPALMHLRGMDAQASSRVLERYMELMRTHPALAPNLVDPMAVARGLAEDHLALEYLLDDRLGDAVWIFGAWQGQVFCERVPWTPEDHERLEEVADLLSGRVGAGSQVANRLLVSGLQHLHARLVDPLAQWVDLGTPHRITIAPGAALNHVPFQALLTAEGRPMALDHAMDFCISLAQLAGEPVAEGRKATKARKGQAVLWSGVEPNAEPLPHARAEVERLAQQLGAQMAVRTVARWSARALGGADIIHYAGHANFQGEEHELGHFRAGGKGAARRSAASPTRAARWLEVDLVRRPLVVLSACDSGITRPMGDEFTGFLRALVAAGADTIIASCWRAHDAATALLMESFYAGLLEGQTPTDALVAAQRAWILRPDALAHPFYWGNFRCWRTRR